MKCITVKPQDRQEEIKLIKKCIAGVGNEMFFMAVKERFGVVKVDNLLTYLLILIGKNKDISISKSRLIAETIAKNGQYARHSNKGPMSYSLRIYLLIHIIDTYVLLADESLDTSPVSEVNATTDVNDEIPVNDTSVEELTYYNSDVVIMKEDIVIIVSDNLPPQHGFLSKSALASIYSGEFVVMGCETVMSGSHSVYVKSMVDGNVVMSGSPTDFEFVRRWDTEVVERAETTTSNTAELINNVDESDTENVPTSAPINLSFVFMGVTQISDFECIKDVIDADQPLSDIGIKSVIELNLNSGQAHQTMDNIKLVAVGDNNRIFMIYYNSKTNTLGFVNTHDYTYINDRIVHKQMDMNQQCNYQSRADSIFPASMMYTHPGGKYHSNEIKRGYTINDDNYINNRVAHLNTFADIKDRLYELDMVNHTHDAQFGRQNKKRERF